LIELALAHGAELYAPGGVLAQVWRDGSRQARLARLIGSGAVRVQPLDREEAQAVGALCGACGARDVVDVSVVLLARRHAAAVVTSAPADRRAIDPSLHIVEC
jgi:hypothetical protein